MGLDTVIQDASSGSEREQQLGHWGRRKRPLRGFLRRSFLFTPSLFSSFGCRLFWELPEAGPDAGVEDTPPIELWASDGDRLCGRLWSRAWLLVGEPASEDVCLRCFCTRFSRCFWMAVPSTATSTTAPYTSHVMPFSSQLTSCMGSGGSGSAFPGSPARGSGMISGEVGSSWSAGQVSGIASGAVSP